MAKLQGNPTGPGTGRGQGRVEKRPQALRGDRSGGESEAKRGERMKRAHKIDMFSQIFRFRIVALVSLCAGSIFSMAVAKNEPAPRLMTGLGDVHHPVSTKSRE